MALPVPRNVFWVRAKIIIKQEGKRQFDELMFCLKVLYDVMKDYLLTMILYSRC